VLTIERGSGVRWSTCADCGRDTQYVHGYVYGRKESNTPSITLQFRTVTFTTAPDFSYRSAPRMKPQCAARRATIELGRRISRSEALASPLKTRYFDVCDLICSDDPRIRATLALT
jgi:hypothetical protein